MALAGSSHAQSGNSFDLSLNRITYTGKYYDREANLFYFGARYYDPETGRFISRDGFDYGTVNNPPSLHLYYYAMANPLRYVDRDGHESSFTSILDRYLDDQIQKENYFRAYGLSFLQTAYGGLDKLTGGAFAAHDQAFDRYEAGDISGQQYARQAGKSAAQVGVFAATAEVGAGLTRVGAGAVTTGAVEGAFGGIGSQAAEDVGKGQLSAAGDYIASGSGGALMGGAMAGATQLGAKGLRMSFEAAQRFGGSRAMVVEEGSGAAPLMADAVGSTDPPAILPRAPSLAPDIGSQGLRLETRAMRWAGGQGEEVIESQYGGGRIKNGFDFLSIQGEGADAQLIINEAKSYNGTVGTQSYSVFGLGRGGLGRGQKTFERAVSEAETRILTAAQRGVISDETRKAILSQLRGGNAQVRLIGGPSTVFDPDDAKLIESMTGFKVTVGPSLP